MQRNLYQTTEDFLQDASFRQWTQQGVDDNGWEEWISQVPDNIALAREAQLILLALGFEESDVPETETESALQATWQKIELSEPEIRIVRPKQFPWLLAAAAAVVLAMGLGWHFAKQPVTRSILSEKSSANQVVTRNNATRTPVLVILEDGSSVILQPGSQLSYPTVFESSERKVSLTGEAFFEISKNPSRPFFVYANEIVTRVVGTSFRIKAYKNHPAVEVIVRTGQVKVSANNPSGDEPSGEIALNPNESIRFVRDAATFEKPAVATPQAAGPIEQLQFDFIDTPVSKILETIGLAYGLEIDYPKDLLEDCYLSTSLSDVPLQQKLKIICESMGGGTRYELREEQIIIFSNGCN